MNTSYCSLTESSDDASIFVNHGLTRSHRKKVVFDSSDDESTAKSAFKDDIGIESPSDDDTRGRSSNADDELRDQMSKLTVTPSDSAWAYDNAKGEFFLTSAEFEIAGVMWPKFSLPANLFKSLYPHQKVGVQWAASLHSNMIGGIL
jgi:SNF2 family DNA or RNA helicase